MEPTQAAFPLGKPGIKKKKILHPADAAPGTMILNGVTCFQASLQRQYFPHSN